MKERSHEKELLDLGPSHYSKTEYEDCLHQLGRIGRYLGGDRPTLTSFEKVREPRSILDVGCGGGQFTLRLAKQFPHAQVTGIDISSEAIDFARKRLQESSLSNVEFLIPASPQLNYPSNSFDVVTATLVCHHLDDDQLVDFLKASYQVARSAVIMNDLHRSWIAYIGYAPIAALFFRNRLILHDGLLSIKRSFKKRDWIRYLEAAGIPPKQCTLTWHWPFRWVLRIDTTTKLNP